MEPLPTKPWQKQKYSLCAYLPSDLSTRRLVRNPSLSGSRLHDLLANRTDQQRSCWVPCALRAPAAG